MPWFRRRRENVEPAPAAPAAMQALTAAGYGTKQLMPSATGDTGWQSAAWDFHRSTPEVRFYADYVASRMAGARLYAGYRQDDGTVTEAPDDSRAADIVRSFGGGPAGQADLLAQLGANLAVAGEAWLVGMPDRAPGQTEAGVSWRVLSTKEVTTTDGGLVATVDGEQITIPYGPEAPDDPAASTIIRVWMPDPQCSSEATSPVRAALGVLEEHRLLTLGVAAAARSRLVGSGVFVFPAGAMFPGAPGQAGAEDDLMETFIDVSSISIGEPGSAAAMVPITLKVPSELVGSVKHIPFDRPFDALSKELREEAMRRFATGLDIPGEIMTGMGQLSHWNAWASTAEALRSAINPRLARVAAILTECLMWPVLAAEGVPDAGRYVVAWDTSALRTSSNKAQAALEAFQLGLISAEAARRELGFTDVDAPDTQPAPRDAGTVRTLPVSETNLPPAGDGTGAPPA